MRFEEVYADITARLEKELPSHLSYHDVGHTKTVVAAAEQLGRKENLTEEDWQLLRTAALFHDTGFLQTYQDHEAVSCQIAKTMLPAYGYEEKDITTICQLIMATRQHHVPVNKSEELIRDADLHYLGTDRYPETAERLFKELKAEGLISDRKAWEKMQVQFFESHRFFTPSAIKEYGAMREAHQKNLLATPNNDHHPHGAALAIQDALMMIGGVLIAGFGLKGFLVPNLFFDGGVTGLSLLLHELYHFNLAWVILVLNLPLLIASYFSVSKVFALKTLVCVVLLGICLQWIEYPVITSDKLLISIFGGVFLGIGIGLTMRAGCALDGIEVLALYTLKRSSLTITEIILGLNILIFGIAAFKFGVETALYSVLTYTAASRMIDYVVEGIQAFTGVTIISAQSERIKYRLVNELGRGITVYKGERGFLPGSFEVSTDADIVFTVITRLEMRKLKKVVYEVDPKAFVFANTIKEAAGGILKRRQRH